MPNLGPAEILVILIVALLVFGPDKLPDIGRQVGRAAKEFRKFQVSLRDEVRDVLEPKPESKSRVPPMLPPGTSPAPVPDGDAEPEADDDVGRPEAGEDERAPEIAPAGADAITDQASLAEPPEPAAG